MPHSYFIFNIHAPNNSDVSFGGIGFPSSRVVYNVIGANTVTINGKVKGSLIAPTSSVTQIGGKVYGTVVGEDCTLTDVAPACATTPQDITTVSTKLVLFTFPGHRIYSSNSFKFVYNWKIFSTNYRIYLHFSIFCIDFLIR